MSLENVYQNFKAFEECPPSDYPQCMPLPSQSTINFTFASANTTTTIRTTLSAPIHTATKTTIKTATPIATTTAAAPGYQIFQLSGTFSLPNGLLRVYECLAIGGGSGGLFGSSEGGGSGYAHFEEFSVDAGEAIAVTVGSGGEGSPYNYRDDEWQDSKAGWTSSFGLFLSNAG